MNIKEPIFPSNEMFPKIEKTIKPKNHFLEIPQTISPIMKEAAKRTSEISKSIFGKDNILFPATLLKYF